MNQEEALALLLRNTEEVVTREEAVALLARPGPKKAYIGYEPSGLFHIGQGLITSQKIKDLTALGFEVNVLLADWHAYINDKMDGDMNAIKACGAYLKDCFLALGVDPQHVHFLYTSDMVGSADYWQKVLKISKASSVSRIRRAMTVMGRKEDEADVDASKLIYPAMQAADIFHQELDLALGGMDQRHAHMLARDAADKLGWKKFVAIHTPLLMSLQGTGRMDVAIADGEGKMSKSKPESCVFLHDSPKEIQDKLNKAYCPAKESKGNPVLDHCRLIIFPILGKLEIVRPEKFGGNAAFATYEELEKAFADGNVHPMDLKKAVAAALSDILAPTRAYLEMHPENLEKVKRIAEGRK
ncbi:MAG: tyrosine--tRNA ligase [Methanobacteriota archaeon]